MRLGMLENSPHRVPVALVLLEVLSALGFVGSMSAIGSFDTCAG